MSAEKRTHKERLAKLWQVFRTRQEVARSSGKKHDVSIAKVCADAQVDKIYLHGYRLKDDSPEKAEYLAIKSEILEFQKNLGVVREKSVDKKRAEELELKYKTLLCDVEPLQRELAYYKTQSLVDRGNTNHNLDRMTQLLARIAELESQLTYAPKETKLDGGISARVQRHVVSPDAFRLVGGKYKKGSRKQEQAAWGDAYKKLEELLSRRLKMRLFILVGMPCSGKSSWAQEGVVASDRHPVIFDATNLSSTDRYMLVSSLSRFKDLPKACIFFDTDMELIRERNRTQRSTDRRLSDGDLTLMNSRLEKPDPYEELWIDELIVVRQHG